MIRITADSSADLGELYATFDIAKMPFIVNIGDESFFDGETITPNQIFSTYENRKILPKTAARSSYEFTQFFNKMREGCDGIVHFSISSKLSSMYDNALLASKEFENVFVVDTKSLSAGVGLLVLKAVALAKEGKSAKDIFEYCNGLRDYVLASFIVENMEFLHKGGRCSGMQRLAATLLRINPVLYLVDGSIEVGEKISGKMAKNVLQYTDLVLKKYTTPDLSRLIIEHTGINKELIDAVKNKILEVYPFKEVNIIMAGSTVSSHCGKGTLGIFYINRA